MKWVASSVCNSNNLQMLSFETTIIFWYVADLLYAYFPFCFIAAKMYIQMLRFNNINSFCWSIKDNIIWNGYFFLTGSMWQWRKKKNYYYYLLSIPRFVLSTSSFTYHWLCIFMANVNTLKKTNNVFILLWKEFLPCELPLQGLRKS